jgi:hypothetical protein
MPKIRTIDTIDGEVKCRYCYDIDNNISYVEFNLRNGYADESDPYEYVGESGYIENFDSITDEELENMYYEFCN